MNCATLGLRKRGIERISKEIWEIISGHSAATVSDRYGGKKPDVLLAANETICGFLTRDAELMSAVCRLTS